MLKQLVAFTGLLLISASTVSNDTMLCGKDSAACAITLEGPGAVNMDCGALAQDLTFIITNNTSSNIPITNGIARFDSNTSTTVAVLPTSCTIVPAHGMCNVYVEITAASCDADGFPQSINANLVVDPAINQGDLTAPISLLVTESIPVVAAGAAASTLNATTSPLLIAHDANGIWKTVTSGFPTTGMFNSASCGGVGLHATCLVGGEDLTGTGAPTLFKSNNGGVDWDSMVTFDPVLSNTATNINTMSCTDDASLCSLAVVDVEQSYIYYSQDQGANWTLTTSKDINNGGAQLYSEDAMDCNGPACAAGGTETANIYALNLVDSLGFAWTFDSWSTYAFYGAASGIIKTTACASVDLNTNPPTQICVFAGNQDESVETGTFPTMYYVQAPNIDTLPLQITLPSTTATSIDTMDCTILNQKVICQAGGGAVLYTNNDTYNFPNSNPTHWTSRTLSGFTTINSISCTTTTGVSPQYLCAIAGENTSGYPIVTTNYGTAVNTNMGRYNSVSCKPSVNNDVVCIVAGTSTGDAPLLQVNESAIATPNNWVNIPAGVLPASGSLNSTGSASGS